MSTITVNNFSIGCNRGTIMLTREGEGETLLFSPGEADTIKELISTALSMEALPSLPGHIDINRFQIQFFPDNTLALTTNDESPGKIPFTWLEGDEVILRIEDGFKIAINEMQLGVDGPIPKYVDPAGFGEPFS